MEYTLRKKLTIIFMVFITLSLMTIGVVHWFFIDDFYVREKCKALEDGYSVLSSGNTSEDYIVKYCQTNNITYILTDQNLDKVETNAYNEERMMAQLFGLIMGREEDNVKVIAQKEHYTIASFKDMKHDTGFLQLTGIKANGDYVYMQTPLESIALAASISNRFFVLIGLIVIVISCIVLFFLTKKLTVRVEKLTEMSEQMAKLDFDVRYESLGKDEIDVLGENFNKMSDSLKESITELKNANIRLAKDIEEKTELENRRREFLSNVSHELKTPIALIQGYAEGIKEMDMEKEDRDAYLDVITDEAQRMNKLVMQLMSLEQLESGRDSVDLSCFDLTEVIKGILMSSKLMLEQANATVVFNQTDKIMVWADEFKIEQVITNYITNAIHHLDGERIIEIRCKEKDGIVETSVFNTGKPIPEDALGLLWNKFYKVDKARTRSYGGSGIGLSIVKAIMDLHGQKCSVKNYDNGVAFAFTLEAKK